MFVDVVCDACWMDVAPEFVGRKGIFSWSAYGDMRNKFVPIWLDERVFRTELEVGPLDEANWRQFSFELPDGLPRALEGTFVAFRWRVEARRPRRVGAERASLPLLLIEAQDVPVVRIETSPIGTWRLLEWRSEHDVGGAGGAVLGQLRRPPPNRPPASRRDPRSRVGAPRSVTGHDLRHDGQRLARRSSPVRVARRRSIRVNPTGSCGELPHPDVSRLQPSGVRRGPPPGRRHRSLRARRSASARSMSRRPRTAASDRGRRSRSGRRDRSIRTSPSSPAAGRGSRS